MSSENTKTRYVVAGGGSAGWMAASLLAKLLPENDSVTLIESDQIGIVGVGEATIPQIRLVNSALGIPESEFVQRVQGSYKLGIEFEGWSHENESYIHGFGKVGRPEGIIPFHPLWVRASQQGFAKPLAAYSRNESAARAQRMGRSHPGQLGGEMPYAFHFDAALYAKLLRDYAEQERAKRVEGKIVSVERGEDGYISALALENGDRIEGDFFIDCTGSRALLIGQTLETEFVDWTDYLPCDHAVAVPCAPAGDLTPYTRSIARKAGWQWRIPLQHRIGNGHVFSSEFISVDEATSILLDNLDGPAESDPRVIPFTTGMRKDHWVGNCLALGLASGFLEPLESTSIYLTQSSITRFLSVAPQRGHPSQDVIDWFNHKVRFEWERTRDFIILHYVANGRLGEPFWDRMRKMELPETLTEKIEMWKANGTIQREHDELFTEEAWFQVLVGQKVDALSYPALADAIPEQQLRWILSDIENRIAGEVRSMRPHTDFLRTVAGAGEPFGY